MKNGGKINEGDIFERGGGEEELDVDHESEKQESAVPKRSKERHGGNVGEEEEEGPGEGEGGPRHAECVGPVHTASDRR